MSTLLERPIARVEEVPASAPSTLSEAEVIWRAVPTEEPRPPAPPREAPRHGFACSCSRCYCSGDRAEFIERRLPPSRSRNPFERW